MEGVICDVLTGATSSPSTRASNSVNGKMHACLGNCWTRSHTTSTLQRSRCAHLLSGVGLLACMERCPGLYRLSTEAPSSGGSRVEHSFTSSSRAPRLPGTLPFSEGAAVDGGALEWWLARRATHFTSWSRSPRLPGTLPLVKEQLSTEAPSSVGPRIEEPPCAMSKEG